MATCCFDGNVTRRRNNTHVSAARTTIRFSPSSRQESDAIWFTSSSCEARLSSGHNSVSVYLSLSLSSKTEQRKHRLWEVLTLPLFGDHGQFRGDRNIVILVVVPSWKGAHTPHRTRESRDATACKNGQPDCELVTSSIDSTILKTVARPTSAQHR
jgi:hypothetical protein